jgi:hypothetical protein
MNKRAISKRVEDKENLTRISSARLSNPLRAPLAPLSISKHSSISCKLLDHYLSSRKSLDISNCLASHSISTETRAHMVSWMIEVCSCFCYSDCTFFSTIHMLDLFLKKSAVSYRETDFLVAGVSCLVICAKIHEPHAFSVKRICKVLNRNKITVDEILAMELVILDTLGYDLAITNPYEVLECIAEEIRAEMIVIHTAKIVLYLILHYYDSNNVDSVTLAQAALVVGASTLNRLDVYDKVVELMNLSREERLMIELVYNAILNFQNIFPEENTACKFLKFEFVFEERGPMFRYLDERLEEAQRELIRG